VVLLDIENLLRYDTKKGRRIPGGVLPIEAIVLEILVMFVGCRSTSGRKFASLLRNKKIEAILRLGFA
jgi:hypothetical protein